MITINAAVGGSRFMQTCFSRLNKGLLINRLWSQGAELHSTIYLSNYALITTVYANTPNICIEHSHNFLLSLQDCSERRAQQPQCLLKKRGYTVLYCMWELLGIKKQYYARLWQTVYCVS